MSEAFRSAGLIYGPEQHHLDHLGPLCALLGIPLIVTEEGIASIAKRCYPHLNVILFDTLAIPEYLVTHFDLLFYCIPRDLFDEVFFFAQKMAQKTIHTIWVPHGNSDKGASLFHMEALKKEKAMLVYGKQMIDFLQKKGVFDQLKGHVVTGNFRHQYFLENQSFYESLMQREIIRKLPIAEKTLLYAPTWQDFEKSCSFFDAIVPLAERLPSNHNLIVKLHPNLVLQEEFKVEEILDNYEKKNNILFLKEFTPIYPLLNLADVYIGDMSSIGYDYLTFDRPMFFLNQNNRLPDEDPGLYLFRCGVTIKREDYGKIHHIIANYFHFELRNFSTIRKEVYTYAFGHLKSLETLKKQIENLLAYFERDDLHFF